MSPSSQCPPAANVPQELTLRHQAFTKFNRPLAYLLPSPFPRL
jgi:hypothetical protein